MRHRLLVPGIVLCAGLGLSSLVWTCAHVTTTALTEEARLAIDVRCAAERGRAGRNCRTMLTKLYVAGALDPDRTLRAYCEGVRTAHWQASRTVPPELCVQRYGGW